MRIRLNTHYYSREAHEPFFTNEERHSWNMLNASRLLFDLSCRDAYDILTHAPSHADVINALIAEHRIFRLRVDSASGFIAYQLDGACIATDCASLTFTHHAHITTDARGNQIFKHVDDSPAYSHLCHCKSNTSRWVEFQPA